jgi:hypothetical protein
MTPELYFASRGEGSEGGVSKLLRAARMCAAK